MRTRHALPAALVVVAALAAGCTTDTNTSSPSDAATSPTATPTLSEEDQAAADAEAAYREWVRVWASCMKDPPNTVSSCFDEVSIGAQLVADYNSLQMSQAAGNRLVGEPGIVSVELVSVDMTDRTDRQEDPVTGLPELRTVPTVVFDVCVDLTAMDSVDTAGESQMAPDAPKYRRTLVVVLNYSNPDPSQWRVGDAYGEAESPTCEP